ncbi:hypothetical protein CP533_3782 [Ophiocordyceps camponoti-saundersi (nom. inval.)]|nr:hypothetical protein CP533_3782 [Ophiocordyceps camponoti-saundersi (nom. inval.)]
MGSNLNGTVQAIGTGAVESSADVNSSLIVNIIFGVIATLLAFIGLAIACYQLKLLRLPRELPNRVSNDGITEIGFTLEYDKPGLAIADFGEYETFPDARKAARSLINFHLVLAGRTLAVWRLLEAAASSEYEGFASPGSPFSEWGEWLIKDNLKSKRAWFGLSKPSSKQVPTPNNKQLMAIARAAKRAGISGNYLDSEIIAEKLMKAISNKWGERAVACLEVMMYRQGAFDDALENPYDPGAPIERPQLQLPPYLKCTLCVDDQGNNVLCDLLDRVGNKTGSSNMIPTQSAVEQRACSQYWYAEEQRCIVRAKKLPEFKGRQCWASRQVVECGGGMLANEYLREKADCMNYHPTWWREDSAECSQPEPFRFFRQIMAGFWPD